LEEIVPGDTERGKDMARGKQLRMGSTGYIGPNIALGARMMTMELGIMPISH